MDPEEAEPSPDAAAAEEEDKDDGEEPFVNTFRCDSDCWLWLVMYACVILPGILSLM